MHNKMFKHVFCYELKMYLTHVVIKINLFPENCFNTTYFRRVKSHVCM